MLTKTQKLTTKP